jgi:transcriptional regulator with XRE-family HTH domain
VSRTAALGLSVAELAMRAAMTDDDIERIEEGGTEPTIPILRRLGAALDADVHLTGGHDLGSVWFETTLPKPRRPGTQTALVRAGTADMAQLPSPGSGRPPLAD